LDSEQKKYVHFVSSAHSHFQLLASCFMFDKNIGYCHTFAYVQNSQYATEIKPWYQYSFNSLLTFIHKNRWICLNSKIFNHDELFVSIMNN